MHDRPTATELLDDIAALLGDEIVPALEGNLRHHARVAANLCRIVSREIALGHELDAVELELLASFGNDAAQRLDAASMHAALADGVRHRSLEDLRGRWPDDLQALRDGLDQIVAGKLAVNKPGYDERELPVTEGDR